MSASVSVIKEMATRTAPDMVYDPHVVLVWVPAKHAKLDADGIRTSAAIVHEHAYKELALEDYHAMVQLGADCGVYKLVKSHARG